MFPSSAGTPTPSFGQRAARTARLFKAFATLDDRPLDASGRPLPSEPESRLTPLHERRPGPSAPREAGCPAAVPSVADLFCAGR